MAWVACHGIEWHGVAWRGIGLIYTYKEIINALKTKGRCKDILLHFLHFYLFCIHILLKMYLFFVTNTNYVCCVDTHCLHST